MDISQITSVEEYQDQLDKKRMVLYHQEAITLIGELQEAKYSTLGRNVKKFQETKLDLESLKNEICRFAITCIDAEIRDYAKNIMFQIQSTLDTVGATFARREMKAKFAAVQESLKNL